MIDLDDDELLVLFECLHRMCETNRIAISHPAEAVVFDKIAGQLERSLAEPFRADYHELLLSARSEVLARYRGWMGTDTWIERLPLEQQ